MTKLHELAELGQSVWLDFIQRSFVNSGQLQRLVDMGLRGVTSNPSIFMKAITGSEDYQADLQRLVREGRSAQEIFESLAAEDIRRAADLLRPVYDAARGRDGFVSLEVNPALANDTEATLAEAKKLWSLVDRPNLMVKIPATRAGLPAIEQATAAGINVNITLIFSLDRYADVMAAYLRGLELRARQGLPIDRIASVASFFVSRVDTKVDKALEEIVRQEGPRADLAANLMGTAAVANARIAYQQFLTVFEGDAFLDLKGKGANLQRPLWASTSTKNPAYADIKYVQELIGANTVNTLPEETLEAFLDHGEVRSTLEEDLAGDRFVFQMLAELGISMDQVTQELEEEGVAAFAKSYDELLESIERKREQERELEPGPVPAGARRSAQTSPAGPDRYVDIQLPDREPLDRALAEMEREQVMARIWKHDHTVWQPEPEGITDRLGWLRIAAEMNGQVPRLEAFAAAVRQAGYTQVLLLGMGGSSLAPELFGRIFSPPSGAEAPHLDLAVLDSTDPAAVLEAGERLDLARTLFVVSTKSGTTEETLSFFKHFYRRVAALTGEEQAGEHFAAITDPDTPLVDLARRFRFREVFLNDPAIGGRYSALSFFGLVPAALSGLDLHRLLDSAQQAAQACQPEVQVQDNPAARLGAALGELAKAGRDKVTFFLSPAIASFGDWVEQLLAESTGKQGKGILPVVGEPSGPPAVYGQDRLFVSIQLVGDPAHPEAAALSHLRDSGMPLIQIRLEDRYDLGGQFFLWELATAVAGQRLGINPFDQPNVEATKRRAREMVAAYRETGALPAETPLLAGGGIEVYGPEAVSGLNTDWILEATGGGAAGSGAAEDGAARALLAFLTQARAGDYIALQAFVQPTPQAAAALQALRTRLRDRYQLATTAGFGPRFLHSTGQLHKGDAGSGLFIQFTAGDRQDVPIPDDANSDASSLTFGVLKMAQASGDRQALQEAGRRVIRFHLSIDAAQDIQRLADSI